MKPDRFFYVAAGAIFLVLTVLGFKQYIFHGKHSDGSPIAPVMLAIVVAHSSAIFVWFVMFFVQALLISTHNRRLHMTLGWGVVGIAALIVVTGPLVAFRSIQMAPEQVIFDWPGPQFLLVMCTEIALFAVFVTIGVLNRKRPRIHRPMMLMASLAIVSGATARIDQVRVDLRASPMDGDLWAGGDAGSAAAGGARGHDAELRSPVCHGPRRLRGGDFGGGKAGDDEHVGRLGGNDLEAVRGFLLVELCSEPEGWEFDAREFRGLKAPAPSVVSQGLKRPSFAAFFGMAEASPDKS